MLTINAATDNFSIHTNLSEESPLHARGYTVSKKASLSSIARQRIIAATLDSGEMTVQEIIQLLSFLIDVNGSMPQNDQAREKWQEDLDFTRNYSVKTTQHPLCDKPRSTLQLELAEPLKDHGYKGLQVIIEGRPSDSGIGTIIGEDRRYVYVRFDGYSIAFHKVDLKKGLLRLRAFNATSSEA